MSDLELTALHWYKTREYPLRLRHTNRKLLVKYVSPTFPGEEPVSKDKRPVHYASGHLILSVDNNQLFFVADGISGKPQVDIRLITEYIFI